MCLRCLHTCPALPAKQVQAGIQRVRKLSLADFRQQHLLLPTMAVVSGCPGPHVPMAVELPYSFRALSQVTWHVFPLVTMEWKLLLSVVASLILSDRAHRSLCPRRSDSSFFYIHA